MVKQDLEKYEDALFFIKEFVDNFDFDFRRYDYLERYKGPGSDLEIHKAVSTQALGYWMKSDEGVYPTYKNNISLKEYVRSMPDFEKTLILLLGDIFLGKTIKMTGRFWYPHRSYINWHTNSNNPGTRVYISWAREPKRSFFRYFDSDSQEVITSWDDKIDVRIFDVGENGDDFWHCVYSETDRLSFGFNIR